MPRRKKKGKNKGKGKTRQAENNRNISKRNKNTDKDADDFAVIEEYRIKAKEDEAKKNAADAMTPKKSSNKLTAEERKRLQERLKEVSTPEGREKRAREQEAKDKTRKNFHKRLGPANNGNKIEPSEDEKLIYKTLDNLRELLSKPKLKEISEETELITHKLEELIFVAKETNSIMNISDFIISYVTERLFEINQILENETNILIDIFQETLKHYQNQQEKISVASNRDIILLQCENLLAKLGEKLTNYFDDLSSPSSPFDPYYSKYLEDKKKALSYLIVDKEEIIEKNIKGGEIFQLREKINILHNLLEEFQAVIMSLSYIEEENVDIDDESRKTPPRTPSPDSESSAETEKQAPAYLSDSESSSTGDNPYSKTAINNLIAELTKEGASESDFAAALHEFFTGNKLKNKEEAFEIDLEEVIFTYEDNNVTLSNLVEIDENSYVYFPETDNDQYNLIAKKAEEKGLCNAKGKDGIKTLSFTKKRKPQKLFEAKLLGDINPNNARIFGIQETYEINEKNCSVIVFENTLGKHLGAGDSVSARHKLASRNIDTLLNSSYEDLKPQITTCTATASTSSPTRDGAGPAY